MEEESKWPDGIYLKLKFINNGIADTWETWISPEVEDWEFHLDNFYKKDKNKVKKLIDDTGGDNGEDGL